MCIRECMYGFVMFYICVYCYVYIYVTCFQECDGLNYSSDNNLVISLFVCVYAYVCLMYVSRHVSTYMH